MSAFSRRDLARAASGFVLAGIAATSASEADGADKAAAPAKAIDPLSLVDPELLPIARRMQETSAQMPLSDAFISRVRKEGSHATPARPGLSKVPFEERRLPVPGGSADVRVFVVNARAGANRPGILHTHGGGYILGSIDEALPDLLELSATLDCVVVTVDYRLAPETRFSGSIEDNYAALLWMYRNASALGVDRRRIALLGESAGGGHAALLAIAARDRREVPVAFQALIYPMLDDRTGSSRPVPPHIGTLGWTAESNRYGWRSFLGQEPGGHKVPARAVPARLADLSGLPPAYIAVGALDLFVEEDIQYASRLLNAGVPVELQIVPGAFHGFDGIGRDTAIAQRFTASKIGALRRATGSAA